MDKLGYHKYYNKLKLIYLYKMNTREFANKIKTARIEIRVTKTCSETDSDLVPDKITEDYYLVINEPNGANRQELKFGGRQMNETMLADPTKRSFGRWIDERYFIVSTGSRFGTDTMECQDPNINWDPTMEIKHDIYRIPEKYLALPIHVPEHLTSIPDLYDGESYRPFVTTPILDPRFCRIHGYWVDTGDKPITRKLQDHLHATYDIKGEPHSNMCKEYKFAPEDPENPEYKDMEELKKLHPGKDMIWPLDAETKIQNYLTPKSRPYHEAMTALVTNILAAANLHGFIFGGYVLGLLEHHAAYQSDPVNAEYRPPNDVDIWMSGKPTPGDSVFSRNGLEWYVMPNITSYLQVSGRKYQHIHDKANEHTTRYGVAKLLIDETYRFDIVCNINNGCKFDTLADFSVTNLYYKVGGDGELKLRTACGGFTLEQVLGHIRTRELRPIIEFQRLFKFVGDQHEYDWYQTKFQTREQKMRDRGYTYPEGVVPLTEQYIPAMADCLAEIRERETAREMARKKQTN